MLNYSVKLGKNNIKRDELVWSEKYLAPDLSFVSGVALQKYHIDNKRSIAYSIGNDTNSGSLNMSCENVIRNGYVKLVDKVYDIKSGSTVNYATDETYDGYRYVEINGVIYYIQEGASAITVNNWLMEDWSVDDDGEYHVNIVEGDVEAKVGDGVVYLDTIVWIEDETVTIDGDKYYFDRYDVSGVGGSAGGLKYYEDDACLAPSAITRTKDDAIQYYHFDNESDYIYATKFKLTQKEQKIIDFDRISYCRYFYYVKYKSNYCPVSLSGDTYVCEVPKRLLLKMTEDNPQYYENEVFEVYNAETSTVITRDDVNRISLLKNYNAYITLEGANLNVENLLQNSNHGDEIGIYLTHEATNISIGDIVTLEDGSYEEFVGEIYEMSGETFALYDNKKYRVKERLCDKVLINEHEYPIDYINGIEDGKDALVDIMGEMVPMMISGDTLERYGLIVSGDSDVAVSASYPIQRHDGVEINGEKYEVISSKESGVTSCVIIGERNTYEFSIIAIEGSSLLICTPNFSIYEFDDDFRDRYIFSICDYFVTHQYTTLMYVDDRAFGNRPITDDIGFVNGNPNPTSSNDYYNLFEHLILYVDTAHIHIPIKLDMEVANNIRQDDIVERDFYEAEKKKAINDIVDMEKDVYIPKYMTSSYSGMNTEFEPVTQIEVNLHFRTRNMDNWKVYDGYNDVSTSGVSDNWFVTDYFPYKQLMEDADEGEINARILQNTSDLMGLLYFTNDDIYYQRDKVGKSFLRFSYYDSTDPQTQSLLATSCVFVDEHKLYKAFIDNSRSRVYNYGAIVAPPEDTSGASEVKVSVMTEFIGKYDKERRTYDVDDIDMAMLSADTRRISSRLIINNKYETDTSSEGFYLYIFKEYSENLHPKPIYMKVEFNHAGVGRTIPFIIPMHWKTEEEYYHNNNVNIMSPDHALQLADEDDLNELRYGYPLSQVYAQTYIPLYAVYDFENKQYAYVFDERYVTPPRDNDGKIVLNLFELKIANEANTPTDVERRNVRLGIDNKAIININEAQFGREHFLDENNT